MSYYLTAKPLQEGYKPLVTINGSESPQKAYLYRRPGVYVKSIDVGFVFDTRIRVDKPFYPQTDDTTTPIKYETSVLLTLRSGLDWYAQLLGIKGIFFFPDYMTESDKVPAKKLFVYRLAYKDDPLFVDEDIANYFDQARSWRGISVLRVGDFGSTIPSWYLYPLFQELVERKWYGESKKLELVEDRLQKGMTTLILPLEQLEGDERIFEQLVLDEIITECRDFISSCIRYGYLPSGIDPLYLLLKVIPVKEVLGMDLFQERVTYPILTEEGLVKIKNELKGLPTWPWISQELRITKAFDYYSLDFVSKYLPDLIRVKTMQQFSNYKEKESPKEVPKPATPLLLKERLLADKLPEDLVNNLLRRLALGRVRKQVQMLEMENKRKELPIRVGSAERVPRLSTV